MNPWFAKIAVLLGIIAMVAIRAPHNRRNKKIQIVKDERTLLERICLRVTLTGFFLPLAWVATPIFDFAEYPLHPAPFAVGLALYGLGMWLFHRAHHDLGTNWSITLQLRQGQVLVTHGVYRYVRHPMYSALLAYGAGQALIVPNWAVAPSYLVPICALVAIRLCAEEQMMVKAFGDQYIEYCKRTRRLIPGIW